MKTRMFLILILSFFSLFSMFDVADASDNTEVYVIGDPEDLPEYNKNLTVNIKVYHAPEKGYIVVRFSKKSSMVGRCTNYPVNDTGNTNDIELRASLGWKTYGSSSVLKYEFSGKYGEDYDIDLLVTTYDSGAWGILSAEVFEKKEDKSPKRKAKNTGTVPRDENGNHIADGWKSDFFPYRYKDKEKEIVNVGATRKQKGIQDYPYSKPLLTWRQNTVDAETGPDGNKENGDGFTVFEEYRGFMLMSVTKEVIRFDPAIKEVGIVLHKSMTAYGTGNVGKHPSHSFRQFGGKDYVMDPFEEVFKKTHTELKDDIPDSFGQINTNSDGIPDTENVYAVRVRNPGKDPSGKDSLGVANRNKPNKRSLVNIYVTDITDFQKRKLQNFTVKQIVNSVTAHEVGHAINLKHCPQSCMDNTKTCLMRPGVTTTDDNDKITAIHVGSSPSSHHYIDYDVAGRVRTPQPAAVPKKKPDDKKKPKAITRSLSSSSVSDTAEAGDSVTVNFSTSSPYSSVYWSVKKPSDTTSISLEIDKGDGSLTTADVTYTFPSGVSGDYVFNAYVYDGDNTTVYEESYTVSVSLPSSTTSTGYFAKSTTVSANGTYEAKVVESEPIQLVHWVIRKPDGTFKRVKREALFGGKSASFSYTVDSTSGTYRVYAWVFYVGSKDKIYSASFTVEEMASPPPAVFRPSSSLTYVPSTGSVSMTVGAKQPIYGVDLYVRSPGDTSTYGNKYGWTSGNSNQTTYSLPVSCKLPAGSGKYKLSLRVYPFNNSGTGNKWGSPVDVIKYVTVK